MILLTDKEIQRALNRFRVTHDSLDYEGAGKVAKAQLKKVVDEDNGLGKFAKAYDMRIDGFVVPWDCWQALLEETK